MERLRTDGIYGELGMEVMDGPTMYIESLEHGMIKWIWRHVDNVKWSKTCTANWSICAKSCHLAE
jgi:hypothetical protein